MANRGNLVHALSSDPNYRSAVKVKLIDLIPRTWSCVNGALYAPQNLIERDIIVPNVRLVLSHLASRPKYVSIKYQDIDGNRDKRKVEINEMLGYDIFIPGRYPESVELEDAGIDNEALDFSKSKDFARFFTAKGYNGDLEFALFENNTRSRIKQFVRLSDYDLKVRVSWNSNNIISKGLDKIIGFLSNDSSIFENELLKAVETEQYERAAELRDKIRKIKEERKGLRQ
ncbi:UvrB/UvrC motif-containing protein [Candidatus Woesearchaeota archaeon]|nr:UvrB/UvrC motif-containing protein [Candidatus Woesearchaeota archaeon]